MFYLRRITFGAEFFFPAFVLLFQLITVMLRNGLQIYKAALSKQKN